LLDFLINQNEAAWQKIQSLQTVQYTYETEWLPRGYQQTLHATAEIKRKGDSYWCVYRRTVFADMPGETEATEMRLVVNDKYVAEWPAVGNPLAYRWDHASIETMDTKRKRHLAVSTPSEFPAVCFGDTEYRFREAIRAYSDLARFDAVPVESANEGRFYHIRRFAPKEAPTPDMVWLIDAQKGFVATESILYFYGQSQKPERRMTMSVEEVAPGLWYPLTYEETEYGETEEGAETPVVEGWRKTALSNIRVNEPLPDEQFEFEALGLSRDAPDVKVLRIRLDGRMTPYVYRGEGLVPQTMVDEVAQVVERGLQVDMDTANEQGGDADIHGSTDLTPVPAPAARVSIQGPAEPNVVTITSVKLEVTGRALECHYRITNRSSHDLWLCESMSRGGTNFEAFMRPDQKTLFIRRRLGVPMEGFGAPPTGRYVVLRSGKRRNEVLSLTLPVRWRKVLVGGAPPRPLEHATRLVLEVGYHDHDLPSRVLTRTHTNLINERLNRNEQVAIPYRSVEGEKVLQVTVEDIRIPYLDEYGELRPPDGVSGTHIEIQFKPSALSFLFPGPDDRNLLSVTEQERLRCLTETKIEDASALDALTEELAMALDGAFICKDATALVAFHNNGSPGESLLVDEDGAVLTEAGQVFRYRNGLRSLRDAIPGLRSLDLRVGCARNLENLWHRFRVTDLSSDGSTSALLRKRPVAYPAPGQWCDAVVQPYEGWDRSGTGASVRPLRCPAVNEGKCHYAMNPNCRPDSPGDMVLLFETKAGWNQHGGPELFAFDHHDPKGGCVLLNDGTVRFIRTEQELHALRWR